MASEEVLYQVAKKEIPNLRRKQVKLFLQKQYVESRHKRLKKTFKRRKVLVLRVDDLWCIDLVQIDNLANFNAGKNYILCVYDFFSGYLWARPLKTKRPEEVAENMRGIIESNGGKSPYKAWTDNGLELVGGPMKALYDEFEIVRYSTNSPLKSTPVEAINSVLESQLFKMMTMLQTAHWVKLLPDAVATINSRPRKRLHNLSPEQAHDEENEEYLREKYLEDYRKYNQQFVGRKQKFRVGDQVRVVKPQTKFQRGYETRTELPLRTVTDVHRTKPLTYSISGKRRKFYSEEIVHAQDPSTEKEKRYYVEKTRNVHKKKLRSGQEIESGKQYLLKARNDETVHTWINRWDYDKLVRDGLLDEQLA